MGFELALPVARWRGFGGTTDFNGNCTRPTPGPRGWRRQRRTSWSPRPRTCRRCIPSSPPRQAVTIDHISNGRFALNLVMGWFSPRWTCSRAASGRTTIDIASARVARRRQAPVDRGGAVRLRDGGFPHQAGAGPPQADPEALPGPDQRRQFAVGDGVLRARRRLQLRGLRQLDRSRPWRPDPRARPARTIGATSVSAPRRSSSCRETEAEARQVYRSIVEHGDWEAAEIS